jgi:hypothetical protein
MEKCERETVIHMSNTDPFLPSSEFYVIQMRMTHSNFLVPISHQA